MADIIDISTPFKRFKMENKLYIQKAIRDTVKMDELIEQVKRENRELSREIANAKAASRRYSFKIIDGNKGTSGGKN